jgi:membrane associated rhomboid family serine protease
MYQLTPVARNLIMINSIIFGISVILPGLHVNEYFALYNVKTSFFRPYQLFTYMFAHADFWHILTNMMGLSFFAPLLEMQWGSMKFLWFYIIVGIGAGVFNILIDLFTETPSFGAMIGASGAVYGALTACALLFPNYELRLMIPPINVRVKYLLLVFGGLAVYSALVRKEGDTTAHFAHVGGIVVALVLLPFWRRNYNS